MLRKKIVLFIAAFAMIAATACNNDSKNDNTQTNTGVNTSTNEDESTQNESEQSEEKEVFELESSMELMYAKNFSVDYYTGGYKVVNIVDNNTFVLVPEDKKGEELPSELPSDATILQMPITNTLISSTPTMSLISEIEELDRVTQTTYEIDSWYIDPVIEKMNEGEITYIGSYKAPDYELMIADKPQLATFSTMLNGVPEVIEKLNELEIPFILDQASFENHPLGKTEWIKLYGALFDVEDKAEEAFSKQVEYVEQLQFEEGEEKKTAAIFYITSKGDLYVRNSGDYVAKMFEMAGGEYIFSDLNPEETGTEKIDFETFYSTAIDADYIIYIWSLGGRPETLDDILEKNQLLADFKAVKEGNVWVTSPEFFQISNNLGYMIKDMNGVITSDADSTAEFKYLLNLK